MASSLTLVLAAWISFGDCAAQKTRRFCAGIALGMTLGFIGDLCMASLIPIREPVLAGMGAFGLGHLAYLGAMVIMADLGRQGARAKIYLAWLCWMLVGLIGWSIIVYPSSAPAALRWAALPYTLLLASTAGFASGLAVLARPFKFLAFGAALFFVSDLILAGQMFERFQFHVLVSPVWLTYGPGQMLIVYGANVAGHNFEGTGSARP
jgi:hypothetical protein